MDERESFPRRNKRKEYPQALKPQKEGDEGGELFKGSLGFDFIFFRDAEGVKHIRCVEINGEHSGISGIQDIPRTSHTYLEKIFATSRSRLSPEFQAVIEQEPQPEFQIPTPQERLHEGREVISRFVAALDTADTKHEERIRNTKMYVESNANPLFIEEISRDKSKQNAYIPSDIAPKIAHNLADMSTNTRWMIKPNGGMQGNDIYLTDAKQISKIVKMMEKDNVDSKELFSENVIQEFIEPLGADNAPARLSNHPASLRLLVDFRYTASGDIEPMYIAGYQRVSPYSTEGVAHTQNDSGKPASSEYASGIEPFEIALAEDIYVVNKARGALSIPLSKEESGMAIEAANRIIRNLGEAYRSSLQKTKKN
ncbi:hypothetical protein A2765_06260 [Candidatus Kaiserbacteria bacterium RIFCSPHIGHO2_01_FULL_56_24]|uniref:Uncharacterized protein n=1 Tax=Candidatus Kaiserbacteria bacterium RIFCSPHIGHO2_01_FULL_56_24 TaxID=1798487 RepID=A0A1F6D9P6_9BACT|nr:MAG: hypothetical protein A2765_06260 [Candidatus Kaiserbacteria bacterium RIFCSPHIGHO2_01_FULL_56_24]